MRNLFGRGRPDDDEPGEAFKALVDLMGGPEAFGDPNLLAERVLARLNGGIDPPKDAAGQIAAIQTFADRYQMHAAERFEVGQIVVRSAGTNCHGHGWPAIIVEIAEEPHRTFYVDSKGVPTADQDYGLRLDMRVMHQNEKGMIHAHWVESWAFELFTEKADA